MTTDFEKAIPELPILRDFVDFVNNQVGVYMDSVAGFQGNTVHIERQVARVQRRVAHLNKDGQPVMVLASVEDPALPEVIHHRIIRAQDFLRANAESGFNHRQVCWSIIVFVFAYWDEQVRPQIAAVRGVKTKDVKVDALGDLRLIRHAIVHNKGVLKSADHAKLLKMAALFKPDAKVVLTHDQMHSLFVFVKQAIGEIILTYTGHLPGAPAATRIVDIAMANVGPRNANGED
ncbi:MAG TPA: hypothetical protein VF912_18740 [Anaeromyxobacter sp.]